MKVTYLERPKGSGSWRLRIETGRDEGGKRQFKYETLRGSEDDAKRRRWEILNSHEQGTFTEPDKVTVAAFFKQWVASRLALKKIAQNTADTYRGLFDKHVAPTLGGVKLQKVRGPAIQALYTKLAEDGELAMSSIHLIHSVINAAFHAARKRRLIVVNPMEEVEGPPAPRPNPKAIETDDVATVLRELRGEWFEVPVIVALGGGMRRGEVLGLRRGDVNLQTGKVSVQGQILQYRDSSYAWTAPKTKAGTRKLMLPQEARDALARHVREQTECRMRLGLGPWKDTDLLFTEADGVSPIRPGRLSRCFSEFCDRIGLPDFTFHGTRHTHATALLRQVGKEGGKAVAERLGHADITVLFKVYQTVFEGDDDELGAMSSGLFGGVQSVPAGGKSGR